MTSWDYINITTGNYTIGRTVKDFRIEGSNDGTNWTVYLNTTMLPLQMKLIIMAMKNKT
jgi:hypothetical protein